MTLAEQIFSALLARHGADASHWPFLARLLLPVFLRIDSCALRWQDARCEESELAKWYQDIVPDLEPSAALQVRLANIALPGERLPREPSFTPPWRLSFAAAMASALLGVLLGASGYFADYTDPDIYIFDATATYEVSNWIAGTEL
ncbi:hypothetical protein [Zhongshania arctica]|uniref:Uncharacterized protein n=1 Tax=Zhongshania arctica TaxID=3238302 RepID=A0ABV3TYW3_9GAMM